MKKIFKNLLLVFVVMIGLVTLTGCTNKDEAVDESTKGSGSTESVSIKDNKEEAEYQIKVAFQKYLEESYGEEVVDARIYVEKIYSASEEKSNEALKTYNLNNDEVAFEIKYELKLAEGVDPLKFTAGTGEYEEESGWIKEKYNVGILRPDNGEYKVTNVGTGF